ncbi:protein takeout-like [Macrobrachium nipponense]|uniref:protein takeout-like n=1 Tax=Macrobrachium nipponense TaxID=159736 RepID=UPI0030C897F8
MYTRGIIAILLVTFVTGTEFASQLRKCRVGRKVALNDCLKQTLEDLRPRLLTGIPELGLPQLEPMKIQNLVFRQGDGAVTVESTFTDVTVTGLSKFTTNLIDADPTTNTLQVGLNIPQLKIVGKYTLNGRVFILAINGDGPFNALLNDVKVTGHGNVGVVRSASGTEHLRISGTRIDFAIDRLNIKLENLFNGDPILGQTVNHFLNQNSQEILKDLKPEVSRQLGVLVERVMNDALSQLPVDSFLIAN